MHFDLTLFKIIALIFCFLKLTNQQKSKIGYSNCNYPAKQYEQPRSCARLIAQIPAGTGLIPGSSPLTQSFLTSAGSRFNDCATTPLYTVKAISHAQNNTPLSCNSLMPIGTAPTPGILKSPCFGFQKGLRVEGFLVLGSFALNTSPKLYFDHKRSSMAYGIAV